MRRRPSNGVKRASLGPVFQCRCGAMTCEAHIAAHLGGKRHEARMAAKSLKTPARKW